MLDDTNVEQQDALGILGVNLIYGAYFYADEPERLMRSLLDNLKDGSKSVGRFPWTKFGKSTSPHGVKIGEASLTPAILFSPDCKVEIPSETLYKRSRHAREV